MCACALLSDTPAMSSATILAIVAAVFVGAAVTFQPLINAKLAGHVGGATYAALISFLAGVAVLLVVNAAVLARTGPPRMDALSSIPPYLFVAGGALGAFFVTASIFGAPQLGTAMWFSLIIAAQLLTSLVIDQFGLFGVEQRPINWPRVLGVLFLIAGATLMGIGSRMR